MAYIIILDMYHMFRLYTYMIHIDTWGYGVCITTCILHSIGWNTWQIMLGGKCVMCHNEAFHNIKQIYWEIWAKKKVIPQKISPISGASDGGGSSSNLGWGRQCLGPRRPLHTSSEEGIDSSGATQRNPNALWGHLVKATLVAPEHGGAKGGRAQAHSQMKV